MQQTGSPKFCKEKHYVGLDASYSFLLFRLSFGHKAFLKNQQL